MSLLFITESMALNYLIVFMAILVMTICFIIMKDQILTLFNRFHAIKVHNT